MASHQEFTEEEELYFGSVYVYFKVTEGSAFRSPDSFTENNDPASKTFVNNRLKPFSFNGQELVIPAIPATDLQISEAEKKKLENPKILQNPLIKVENGQIRGIQSGARSGLLKIDGEWFRLKGCGNLNQGFPLEFVENKNFSQAKEIRGCAFEHTTYRELYISNYVDNLLKPLGLECANKPLGWWQYQLPDDTLFPQINRCCILFKTLGNKRLGDNLLLGLEKLLPFFINLSNFQSILNYFPKQRTDKDSSPQDGCPVIFPTSVVSLTGEFGEEMDFHNFGFEEMIPDISSFKEVDEKKWGKLWRDCCDLLRKYYSSNPKQSLISHIYWRLGRETGIICGCFTHHNFSWGTYEDILGFHCNSHVNNLVLLPQNKNVPGSPLLAPLDFDMAYTENSFSREKNKWDEWSYLEKSGMKLILSGDSEANTGVRTNVTLSPEYTIIKYALRDTMVAAFNDAFDGKEDRHPPIAALDDYIYALLKLALIITENETA